MAEQTIVGVDFSGRKKRNTTAVTVAVLRGEVLEIKPYQSLPKTLPETHDKLIQSMEAMPPDAVVALDFPFSVPQAFATELAQKQKKNLPCTMPDVWKIVSGMDCDSFNKLRGSFVERHGDLLRRGDVNVGGAFSPLREYPPSMWQMTYYGMKLLHRLWTSDKGCFRVPPLPAYKCKGPILLETMPGVLLRDFGLPSIRYKKTYRDQIVARKNRQKIVGGLSDAKVTGISLKGLDQIPEKELDNDDWLDSLAAAIGAALWAKDKSQFLHPREDISPKEEIQAAQLEGWIYTPKPVEK